MSRTVYLKEIPDIIIFKCIQEYRWDGKVVNNTAVRFGSHSSNMNDIGNRNEGQSSE